MSEAIGNLMEKGGLKGSGHFARMSFGRRGDQRIIMTVKWTKNDIGFVSAKQI